MPYIWDKSRRDFKSKTRGGVISASAFRDLIKTKNYSEAKRLVPNSTWEYIENMDERYID